MKKILLISLMLVLLATTVCFAADEQVYEPAEPVVPAYVATNYVSTTLLITSGTAEYTAELKPKAGMNVTKVVVTMKLVNGTGKTIQTTTGEMRKEGSTYILTSTKALTERGKYHVETTLRVYDGMKLLETIPDQSTEKSW